MLNIFRLHNIQIKTTKIFDKQLRTNRFHYQRNYFHLLDVKEILSADFNLARFTQGSSSFLLTNAEIIKVKLQKYRIFHKYLLLISG